MTATTAITATTATVPLGRAVLRSSGTGDTRHNERVAQEEHGTEGTYGAANDYP